jgi:hypothetical protein
VATVDDSVDLEVTLELFLRDGVMVILRLALSQIPLRNGSSRPGTVSAHPSTVYSRRVRVS